MNRIYVVGFVVYHIVPACPPFKDCESAPPELRSRPFTLYRMAEAKERLHRIEVQGYQSSDLLRLMQVRHLFGHSAEGERPFD